MSPDCWSSLPSLVRTADPALSAVVVAALVSVGGCNALPSALPITATAAEDVTLTLQPVYLAARSDHHAAKQPPPLRVEFAKSGWIRGFTIEVIDHNGDSVPSSILHHVKVLNPGRRELFMPIALRLVGAGGETRAAGLPRWLGVPIEKGDSVLVTAMVHNPTEQSFHGVRVRVRLHFTLRGDSKPTAVYPFFLHVTPPDRSSEYDLPPGYSERSWEARPAVGGRVIALGGHLHRYGVMLRLQNLTTGQEIWRTQARSDASGNIVDIPRKIYRWSRGPRIDADHIYRVTASYFNPTVDTIRGAAMGTIGGAFRPAAAWPEVDRRHPLYAMDLKREQGDNAWSEHGATGAPPMHRH